MSAPKQDPRVEKLRQANEQLRREAGIERVRVSEAAQSYVVDSDKIRICCEFGQLCAPCHFGSHMHVGQLFLSTQCILCVCRLEQT